MQTDIPAAPVFERSQVRDLATVDIVIPVLNEERALEGCVRTLHAFLSRSFPWPWTLTVVDNGSSDGTWDIAARLAGDLPGVRARRLGVRGKGAAVKTAWAESAADIVAYMDVDLSTDLDAFLPLIAPLASGHSEIAIGTRLARGSRISRCLKREAVSRAYNAVLKHGFCAGFSDAACGFKAARSEVARSLLPKVRDDGWFFDTELLLLAEHNGLRVHEVPVDWVEDTDSKVEVVGTALHNLRGLLRIAGLISSGAARLTVTTRDQPSTLVRFASFAAVGSAATLVHACAYYLLRAWWSPGSANLAALLVTGFANTEAHRRWTFPHRTAHPIRVHFRAGALFLVNYLVTSAMVYLVAGQGRGAETVALVCCAAAMTMLRFVALDRWVFPYHHREERHGPRRDPQARRP